MRRILLSIAGVWLLTPMLVAGQAVTPDDAQGKTGVNMSGMSMPNPQNGKSEPTSGDPTSTHAMHAMESRHMDMGPHMRMTPLRDFRPGDQERANAVVETARKIAEQYTDYKTALADGYKIFLPNVPQKQYHFTNYRYAFEAALHFNPDRPTSLLYEKDGDGYKLVGVMYTAPKNATREQLDERIPLSIAQWHAHINLCLPPDDRKKEMWGPNPKFGLRGSIISREACEDAGGRFMPQIFGWMVHVYPFEKDDAGIWSVERQATPAQANPSPADPSQGVPAQTSPAQDTPAQAAPVPVQVSPPRPE